MALHLPILTVLLACVLAARAQVLQLAASYSLQHTGDLGATIIASLDGRPGRLEIQSDAAYVVDLDTPTRVDRVKGMPRLCTGVAFLSGQQFAACCGGTAALVTLDDEGEVATTSVLGSGVCVDVAVSAGLIAVQREEGLVQVYSSISLAAQAQITIDPAPDTITGYNGLLYWASRGARHVRSYNFATLEGSGTNSTLAFPLGRLSTFAPPGSTRLFLCSTTTNAPASQTSVACYVHA